MHYEILVEGQCELTTLSIILPKMLGIYSQPHTWKIHKHRGIGTLPADFSSPPKATDTSLLGQLPAKLKAYSKVKDINRKVIVLVDLDDKIKTDFLLALTRILNHCEDGFSVDFVLAEEELEAWYLGDRAALISYNPKISVQVLNRYIQDSICDTWRVLLEADEPLLLKLKKRDPRLLEKKVEWAKKIPPHMDINNNLSPSFVMFSNIFI